MQDFEIPLPAGIDCAVVEEAIEHALNVLQLTVTLRGSLKKYPGCLHWHTKFGRKPGTLEITLWPGQHRAWFSIQSGRNADWIADKLAEVSDMIWRELTES